MMVVPITDDDVGGAGVDAEAAEADQVIIHASFNPECFLEVCFRRFFFRKRADTSSLPARLQWLQNTYSCCFAFGPPCGGRIGRASIDISAKNAKKCFQTSEVIVGGILYAKT